jgi:DTW domain-containing protein
MRNTPVRNLSLDPRCERCYMKPRLCLCSALQRRQLRTQVTILTHDLELRKTTNTGRMIDLLVEPCDIIRYGGPDQGSCKRPVTPPERVAMVLFPRPGAPTVAQAAGGRPVQLIALDGTWHQAKRLRQKVAQWGLPFVQLSDDKTPSMYALRHGHWEHSLSTAEAVARALGELEGPEVEAHILDGLRRMIDRLRWLRGDLDGADVYGGLPEGIERHTVNAPVAGF